MDNFLMQLLAKLLDKSKAKNPLIWFIVACAIGAVQVVVSNATVWGIPIGAEWLKALQAIITVGSLLFGSRTTQLLAGAEAGNTADLPPPEELDLPTRTVGRPRKTDNG